MKASTAEAAVVTVATVMDGLMAATVTAGVSTAMTREGRRRYRQTERKR